MCLRESWEDGRGREIGDRSLIRAAKRHPVLASHPNPEIVAKTADSIKISGPLG
jgi:hypothetical protein